MKLSLSTLAPSVAALICLALTAPAHAQLVSQPWDGGFNLYASQFDTNTYGNYSNVYDNFTLGSTSNVTGATWNGGYFNGGQAPIAGFTLTFLSDSGGAPGAVLATENIPGTANETSVGNSVYSYSATFPAFAAAAGTQYWLGIQATIGFQPQWGWASGTGGDGSAYQVFFGTGSSIPHDMAFSLSGQSAVPEPGTYAMIGSLGLTGAAFLRRRRVR